MMINEWSWACRQRKPSGNILATEDQMGHFLTSRSYVSGWWKVPREEWWGVPQNIESLVFRKQPDLGKKFSQKRFWDRFSRIRDRYMCTAPTSHKAADSQENKVVMKKERLHRALWEAFTVEMCWNLQNVWPHPVCVCRQAGSWRTGEGLPV